MMKSFAIVLFTSENRYSVVPSTWLKQTRKGECYYECYWPGNKTKNPTQAQTDRSSKPDGTFKLFPIQFVKFYDTFERASRKATILKSSSEVEIFSSGTESDSRNSTHILTDRVQSDVTDDDEGNSKDNDVTLTNSPIIEPESVFCEVSKLREEFHLFQRENFKSQEQLKLELADVKKLLRNVLQNQESNGRNEIIHTYPTLPFHNEAELNSTEAIIIDQDQYNALVNELKRIGGTTTTKQTYNVLKHCIAHDLALKLRYTDKSGKVAFGQTRVAQAVRDAILANPQDGMANVTFINMLIGKWLRNSTDRGKNKDDSCNGFPNETII